MAESSGFFNSINDDRLYDASFFAEYFKSFIGNGVFPNPSTNLQVISNNDMTVTIKAGRAWINGYIYINDSDLILPIEVADGVLNRIDRIVLQYSTIDRSITAKVKKGTFASSPVAPLLQRDADAYELGLADVYVGAGVTSVTQANITDLRLDSTYCGWVDSLIEVDPTTLFTQLEDGFNTWFNDIKGQLSTDAAGNLQNQIINHNADTLFQTAGGAATAITLTINESLVNGFPITFICSTSNSGAATTINGKSLYKPGGTSVPNLVAGKAYTVWYSSSSNCFFIKASAEGDAVAANVLAGKKFSNDEDIGLTGTLDLSNLIATNIKKDVVIDDITGTCEPLPTPTAGDACLLASSDAVNSVTCNSDGTKVCLKQFTVNKSGTYRVCWEAKTNTTTYCNSNQLFVNEVARGTVSSVSQSTYYAYTRDIILNAGDVVKLYTWNGQSTSSRITYVQNFRVYVTNPYDNPVTINL